MRIGVDGRHLTAGRGVARTSRETLRALAAQWPDDELVVLGAVPFPAPNVRAVAPPVAPRAAFAVGARTGRPALERLLGGRLDVVWLPAPAPVGLAGDAPLVVTVHDLSWELRPRDFTAYERAWHRAARPRALVARAARTVAVSHATRRDLVERWGADPARVAVVAPGVWRGADGPPGPRSGGPLLCVGALEPRKAPELLAGAHARARARGLDADLVFAGSGRRARALAGRPGVRVLGAVDDATLDGLYRRARAVVHPAWLEGFGMPPLEGVARGAPAIVADLPVYDETLGAAGASRFAPGDARDLADALLAVDAAAPGLVAAGRAAIAPLTWEAAARGLRAVLAAAAR